MNLYDKIYNKYNNIGACYICGLLSSSISDHTSGALDITKKKNELKL